MGNSLKTILIFVYAFTSSMHAHADVIGLGNSAKILEFQRYLQKEPNLTSLNTQYVNSELKKTEEILKSKYELAVKGLLLADLAPSTFVFKEIVSWQKKSLISFASSQIILQSHMRLAHLEKQNSVFWISHSLFFDPDYQPKEGLFNPELMRSLESQRQRQNPYLYTLDKSEIADENTHLFVNGVPSNNKIKIHPSGQFKLTFLKEGFEKLELNANGNDMNKLKFVKLKALDLGTCKSPKFRKKFGIQIEKIYFNKDCIRSIQENIPTNVIANSTPTALGINDKTPQNANQDYKRPTSKKNIFQKKTTWYIIGTAVATGLLVAAFSNQGGQPERIPVEL